LTDTFCKNFQYGDVRKPIIKHLFQGLYGAVHMTCTKQWTLVQLSTPWSYCSRPMCAVNTAALIRISEYVSLLHRYQSVTYFTLNGNICRWQYKQNTWSHRMGL